MNLISNYFEPTIKVNEGSEVPLQEKTFKLIQNESNSLFSNQGQVEVNYTEPIQLDTSTAPQLASPQIKQSSAGLQHPTKIGTEHLPENTP